MVCIQKTDRKVVSLIVLGLCGFFPTEGAPPLRNYGGTSQRSAGASSSSAHHRISQQQSEFSRTEHVRRLLTGAGLLEPETEPYVPPSLGGAVPVDPCFYIYFFVTNEMGRCRCAASMLALRAGCQLMAGPTVAVQ
jgi:hypothetical protein